MAKRISFCFLIIFIGSVIATAQPSSGSARITTGVSTIGFCELISKPDLYDGKQVTLRANYISTFEVSAFSDSNCADKDRRMWVEFDRASISDASEAAALKKLADQIYCCMWAGLSEIRETAMVVTGVFHKPNVRGYGHDNEYCYMISVKSVQEIGTTKTIKVPGFN
jgi:hypothetical protein